MLWLALLLTVPVPYYMVEVGRIPTVALWLLAAVTGAAAIAEGGTGTILPASLFLAQASVATAVFYGLARLVVRRLERFASHRLRRLVVIAIVCALLGTSLLGIYSSLLTSGRSRINLLGVLG